MNRLLVFGALFLLPTAAMAMPFFNHYYNEEGYSLDANNTEDRKYECKMKYDLEYLENGKIRPQVIEQVITIAPKWSGRVVSLPSTPQSRLQTYKYNILCN